jgi:hypothetical protein
VFLISLIAAAQDCHSTAAAACQSLASGLRTGLPRLFFPTSKAFDFLAESLNHFAA